MSKYIKKIAVAILVLISISAIAADEPHYIWFQYNVHSIDKAITDKQCVDLYSSPLRYTIVNDKPIYESNPNYTISDYQRSNVTYLSKDHYLFTGSSKMVFVMNGKTQRAKENISFVLSIPEQKVQGSFILEGFCKGNQIGVNETANQWPPVPQ